MLKMESIKKIYQMGDTRVDALAGVSFEINPGEFVAIMGPSGSGKSTLMNIIGGLDQPSEGSYKIDGIEVAKMTDNELATIRNRKIGFVFQSFNLLARNTAYENVELPMIYAGFSAKERHKRAMDALEIVGIAGRAGHKPKELSGGQQQRVAIARSLVNSPSIILADEPTGNLDSRTEEEIMRIFNRLNNQGITIVLVTHDESVAAYAKRILRLRDGLLVKDEMVNSRSKETASTKAVS